MSGGARFLHGLLHVILPLFGRVQVVGREHLVDGGQVLVSNHFGWADPVWVAYAVYPRRLHQMAKRELFESRIGARLLRALGAFPVDRGRPSPSTLKYAVELLRRGEWLLIFPTGTRNQEESEARRGAAAIAALAGVPIVPLRYEGPAKLSLLHLLRKPRIVLRIGTCIETSNVGRDRQSTAHITARLEEAIGSLGPPAGGVARR